MNQMEDRKIVAAAIELFEARDIKGGIEQLIALIEVNPNHPEAIRLIGLGCASLPNKNQAIGF